MVTDMLKHAPMFRRIKVWKKYKGNVPAMGVGQTRGQAAVIKQGAYTSAFSVPVLRILAGLAAVYVFLGQRWGGLLTSK